jgi:plasmid maintenance system antidote protein VapI
MRESEPAPATSLAMTHELTLVDLSRRILAFAQQCVATGLISIARLAKLAGISQPHMQHIIRGQRPMPPQMADTLVRILGIHPLELYTTIEMHALIDQAADTARARLHVELDLAAARAKDPIG